MKMCRFSLTFIAGSSAIVSYRATKGHRYRKNVAN